MPMTYHLPTVKASGGSDSSPAWSLDSIVPTSSREAALRQNSAS
jgi:hypothetical protein